MNKSSINKVILIGRIGGRPEGRYTPSGVSVVKFSLATDESWVDTDNKTQEHTEWHNVEAWGKVADFVSNYLTKGQLIYIEGKLRSSSWTDKDGINRKKTFIVCQTVTALEWKKNDSQQDIMNRGSDKET